MKYKVTQILNKYARVDEEYKRVEVTQTFEMVQDDFVTWLEIMGENTDEEITISFKAIKEEA